MAEDLSSLPNVKSAIVIELPKHELGEFIASLLGQPRKISQYFLAQNFCADRNFVVNIVDIIDQRLSQNSHKLISF